MIFPRLLPFSAVLIFGAGLTAVPAPAYAASDTNIASPAPSPLSGKVVEDIVARVNDQIITQSDYQRALQQLEAESRQQDIPPQELEERKNNLLRDLIDQQLLLSKGKDLGITGENELIRRLDEIRKQNHLDSLEDLEKAAQQQGVSYEDFKANIRNGIITQEVVREEVGRRISMSPAQVLSYFKAHESEFAQPESVRLSEILIPTSSGSGAEAGDASQVAAARARADAIEAKLKAGANFADLAKSSSIGPTASEGGGLGEFRRGMLAKELEDKTFSLKDGQFTAPIRTKQGYVILQVTHHAPGGEASFKDVEPQVEEALFLERMQPALRQYLTKLREEAYVEIKPGFVDSGGSPNEIHPTYSAYVPPAAKKKKRFTRGRFRGKVRSSASKVTAANTAPAVPRRKQEARQAAPSVEKPGRREKIRFGQAPRESLPQTAAVAPVPAAVSAPAASPAPVGATQTAGAVNPDIKYVNPDGSIDAPPEAVTEEKTRFSQRAVVRKVKKSKQAKAAAVADAATPPTAEELAAQKVQAAPLGLSGDTSQPKKKKKVKVKGPKTRYTGKPKEPEQTQQPYMGPQEQTEPADRQPGGNEPAPNGAQP